MLDPSRCALVTNECQHGAVGDEAIWPPLAAAARPILPFVARLAAAARAAGVPVVHCVTARRADLRGSSRNAPIFDVAARTGGLRLGTRAVEVVDELEPAGSDVVITKIHGIGPMHRTGLDPVLRNLGVRTIVAAGVSLNLAIPSLVLDAVTRGYEVVVPRDAVAGVPDGYARDVLEHTISPVARVDGADEVVAAWAVSSPPRDRGAARPRP